MRRLVMVLFCGLLLGCKPLSFGPYTSPRLEGRVLAADTRQPLDGVKVSRRGPTPQARAGWGPKGGELLMPRPETRTDANGNFALPSERVLSVIRGYGWSSVRLTFQHAGYEVLQTNVNTLTLTTNSTATTLNVGNLLLSKLPPAP